MRMRSKRTLKGVLQSVVVMGIITISTNSLAHGESCSSGRMILNAGEKSADRFLAFWEKDRFVKICGIVSNQRTAQRFGASVTYYRIDDADENNQLFEPQANTDEIKACYFLEGHRFRLVISDTVGERKSTVLYDYEFCVVLE